MANAGRGVRLSDVAKHAGVSAKTVSNVLHNHRYVSERTRQTVEASLAALGYQVNLSARALASRQTGFIGLAIPGLDNPYYAEMASHVMDAAAEHGWVVLIEQTRSSEALEGGAVRGPASYLVDGLILQPDSVSESVLTDRFAHKNLVLIGQGHSSGSADHVSGDPVSAARDLVEHLIAQGRTRIATIGVVPHDRPDMSEMRYRGAYQAMEQAGLEVRPDYLVSIQRYRRPDGAEAADRLLALPEPPDAIVCVNDLVGSGVLTRLRERGVAVPAEIAVAGFDNNEESQFTSPPLTSIDWGIEEIARRCVDGLAARMKDPDGDHPPRRTVVKHKLVARESTIG